MLLLGAALALPGFAWAGCAGHNDSQNDTGAVMDGRGRSEPEDRRAVGGDPSEAGALSAGTADELPSDDPVTDEDAVVDADASRTAGSAGSMADTGADERALAAGASEAAAGAGGADAGAAPEATALDETAELEPTLFFLDVIRARVIRFSGVELERDVVVNAAGSGPDGVAVDVDGGHIYWTNMGSASQNNGFISRSNLDGSEVTQIVEPGGTFTPKQLKLEPSQHKLYWSDREGMRVQRANLDGSELETLVTIATGEQARRDRANHCVGISVDLEGGFFYWTQKGPDNGGVGSIKRAHLQMPRGETHATRSDVEVLYAGLPEPIDLEVDGQGGYMYWTDRGDDTVNRAPIEVPEGTTPDARSDREILVEGVREAIGITVDYELGHVYYTSADNQLGRVDLDGSNHVELFSDAGVLTGITVVRLP